MSTESKCDCNPGGNQTWVCTRLCATKMLPTTDAPESNYFETNKESALKFEAPTDEGWKGEITSLVGEASMCWNPTPTGVFDSEEAITIAFKICKIVELLLQKEREKGFDEGKEARKRYDIERNYGTDATIASEGYEAGKSKAFSLVKEAIEESRIKHNHSNRCKIDEPYCIQKEKEVEYTNDVLFSISSKLSTLEGK